MDSRSESTTINADRNDCAGPESRAAEAGGRVFKPKMSIGPHGFISLLYDTEGNMIGVHSMK